MEENQKEEKQEQTPAERNSMVWIAVVAVIVIVGIAWFASSRKKNGLDSSGKSPAQIQDAKMKNFDISAKPFEFSVKEIRVKKGDKVRINLTVTQGMHDWVVDEFNARTNIIQTGQSGTVEFVADKTGTYEYYCSVPTHRQQGMVGKLIVE